MEVDESALLPRLLIYHGIPEEGPVDLMIQDVVINPVAMAEILAGHQEMESDDDDEEGGDEAAVGPEAMIENIDNQEMEDNEEQDQPL